MKAKSTLLLCAAFVLTQLTIKAQTNTFPTTGSAGIGTTTPVASALLEMKSTRQGLLIPRMTKSQRDAITSPATGLMIYQTNSNPGFYYFDSSKWNAIAPSYASRNLNNLTAPTVIKVDLLPDATNTESIGSSTLRWKDVNLNNLKFADGSTQTTSFIPYTAGTGITISGQTISATAGSSQWTTSGSNIFYTAGNVGIGTSSPTLAGLVVNKAVGNVNAMFGNNTTGIALESNWPGIGLNSYYSGGRKFMAAGYADVIGSNPTDGSINFGASTASGTANTAATVNTIFSISKDGSLAVTGTQAGYIMTDRHQTNYGGYNWYADGGKIKLYRYTLGGDLIAIDSLGRMGIGTTSPSYKLDVTGYTNTQGLITSVTDYSKGVNATSVNGPAVYGKATANGVGGEFTSSNGYALITDNGNVGIGTAAPLTAGLVVETKVGAVNAMFGPLTTGVAIESNYPGVGFNSYYNGDRKFIASGYAALISLDPTTGLFGFYNSGVTGTANNSAALYASMVINKAGNIGMGTTSPAYKLDVCGTIRSKEVLVQTGWCDYVFDKTYKLRSLNEVEDYININKHLPDVPSATEVEDKGVQVAQMDSILIKKVEELTLYVIDQNKQIQQLQQKLVQLENKDADKQNH